MIFRKTCLLPLLTIACYAQSVSRSFDDEYAKGVHQNPHGVTLTIATVPADAVFHLSDNIRFKVSFASSKSRFYTAELGGGGSAAGASFDFIIQGPGMPAPIHSRLSHPFGVVCCGSKRRYVTQKGVAGPEFRVSLKRMEGVANASRIPPSLLRSDPIELKLGDYAVFAQTRSVMRGWPKSQSAAFHEVSDFVLTSANVLNIKILPDATADQPPRP